MSESAIADFRLEAGTTLHRSIDVVWPPLLDQESWMKDFIIQSIAGERNTEGEVKRVTPTVDPKSVSVKEVHPFYFKTLALTPLRKLVYKAYTEHRGGEYSFTGIELLTLSDIGSSTLVNVEAYLEFQSDTMNESQLNAFVSQGKTGSAGIWERNFQRLRALVGSS